MDAAIVAEGLTKLYGRVEGIVDLDLEVRRGEVFGFLGPNGAGKSTTIRTLLDFLHPTRGQATLLGFDSRKDSVAVRRRTGYLPAELQLYGNMTARELLRYFCALRGFDGWPRIFALAERLQLDLDRRIDSCSTGNRQKIGMVQAFMHEPELLILDEPTGGLDPLMQQEFFAMIDEVRADGRTVFLSSHVLPEVERLADRVGIVRQSRLIVVEEVESLKRKAIRRLEVEFEAPVDPAEFRSLEGVRDVRSIDGGRRLEIAVLGPVHRVVSAAARHRITNLVSREGDLEEIFLALYRDGDAA